MKYLDPLSIAKIKNLRLSPRRLATTAESGAHLSPSRGLSRDFSRHRPYVQGDETRFIDWKAYARADRLYVREFEAENLATAAVVLDASGSMGFSSPPRPSKWDLGCRLGLAAAYLILSQGDAAGLMIFDGSAVRDAPPRTGMPQLQAMDSLLGGQSPSGRPDPARALAQIASRLKRPSLVVLVSDLLGDAESVTKGIAALKSERHQVVVFQVLDPLERDFDFEMPAVFESLEDDESTPVGDADFRGLYVAEFERQAKLYQTSFRRDRIAHALFLTGRPWEDDLGHFLEKCSAF